MTHLDYTWEKREQMIWKEEFEDGVAEGMECGIAQGIERGVGQGSLQRLVNQVCCKLKNGKTPEYPVDEICRALMN